jgi:hypothetical protein
MAVNHVDEPKTGFATDSHLTLKTRVGATDVPFNGLIIDSLHIDKILAGTGTWEMRSGNTNRPGLIALIKQDSGQIVGVANLVAIKGSISYQDRLDNINQHRISEEYLRSGGIDNWDVAWVLENAQPLLIPINYHYSDEDVIWVNLELQVQEELALAITGTNGNDHD